MKKLVSLLVCLMLILQAVAAFAVTAELPTTQAAAAAMDAKGWNYTVRGMTSDGKEEKVTIGFNTDNRPDGVDLVMYFTKSTERLQIVSWNIITYDENSYWDVLRVCNQLNDDYVYVKFFCDETDNTVTAEFDAYIPLQSAGQITTSMINVMVKVIDDAYPTLAVYAK